MRQHMHLVLLLVFCALVATGERTRAEDAPLWSPEVKRIDRQDPSLRRVPARDAARRREPRFQFKMGLLVLDGVRFRHGAFEYALAGASPLPPNQLCQNRAEGRWACAARARTMLRALLSRPSTACRAVATNRSPIPLRCETAEGDLAAMLIGKGLAFAAENDATFRPDEEKARRSKAGVWSPAEPADRKPAR